MEQMKGSECLYHIMQQMMIFKEVKNGFLQVKIEKNEDLQMFLEAEVQKIILNEFIFLSTYINQF